MRSLKRSQHTFLEHMNEFKTKLKLQPKSLNSVFSRNYNYCLNTMKTSLFQTKTTKIESNYEGTDIKSAQQSEQAFNPRLFDKNKKKKILKVVNNLTIFYYDAQGNRRTLNYQKISQTKASSQIKDHKKAEKQAINFDEQTLCTLYQQIQQNMCNQQLNTILIPAPLFSQPQYYSFAQNALRIQ